MKLIIDTDPGVDDALAIALAAALPEVEIAGLTTIFGNTFVEQSSRNARYLLDMLGVDAPVAEGARLPDGASTYEPSANVHGPEGFGDLDVVPEVGKNDPRPAAEFLCDLAAQNPGELVVCAIGPLTNIANALKLDRGFAENLGRLVIMGGAFNCPGNITPQAEANIYHDALAADAVFASDLNMSMVGLNATMQTLLTVEDFAQMAATAPKVGGFVNRISQFYLEFYRSVGVTEGCPMHDATAILACTNPERFTFMPAGLQVSTKAADYGATIEHPDRTPVQIARAVDADWAVAHVHAQLAALS